MNSEGGRVKVLVSKEKWVKKKTVIDRIQKDLDDRGSLDHKTLERERGFSIYLSRTYTGDENLPYIRHMGDHLCHMVTFYLPYVVIW